MKKQELMKGEEFLFNNEEWCNENFNDDFREASVSFSEKLDKFIIFFNGGLVHASKSFKSLENKINALSVKWNLKLENNL